MNKTLKLLIYVVACAALVVVLAMSYKTSFIQSPTASAFEWEKSVKVYFFDTRVETNSCEANYPVDRVIPNAEMLGPGALDALIKGPSEEYGFTLINKDTVIQNFEVKDKIVYVDFNPMLSEGVVDSCKLKGIRSQIEKTLTSLPDITSVVISVNGKNEGVLGL